MNLDDDRGTPVQHRLTEYKPPKSFRSWLIGNPLQTADAPHQTIGKLVGLAVFASDALSSTAYATQEMLVILVLAGTAAIQYAFPISIAIVVLLAIITLSYEQTVHAYPGGAGSYIVSRDNLGTLPSLIAAAALLTDYILTVAVSISSSIAQIVSAFPGLFDFRVWIAVGLVMFVMVVNLRGVKESGSAFAIPTYFFMIMMFITMGVGFFRLLTGQLGQVVDPPELELLHEIQPISIFLILRAFANGTTALTGVEAISDGITAFKEPRSKNAGITLIWMSFILGSMLLGITFLAQYIQAVPSEAETAISQIARTVYGNRDIFYLMLIAGTTVILVMAANTAFADFPRLSAFTAADGFLPRQLAFRGSRLVYSRGIVALAGFACLLIVVFQASVTKLIPLYAIGVFLSFTLSQAGMAHRWWKSGHLKPGEEKKERGSIVRYEKNWELKMVVNGFGSVMTFVVAILFGLTKFADGAWIIILITPIMVGIFWMINRHYRQLAKRLSLDHYGAPPRATRHRVIMAVGGVHRGTMEALRYARMLSNDITAVHVSIDPEEAERIKQKWETWGDGYRLVILDSPYRLFIEPLLEYIEEIDDQRQPNELITLIVPQFIPKKKYTEVLHSRTAGTLRNVLLNRSGIVITEVPYQVD
jgi:amino acid transporter